MTKKVIRIVAVVLVVLVMIAISGSVFAASGEAFDPSDLNSFEGINDTSGAGSSLGRIIGAIINIARIVGTGVAIIMLIVLAIKYISAAPGDKADIKKHAVVYVVGAIVLFAASGILGIVQNFAGNINAN